MKELKNNVNTLLWLMVTLSLLVMFSLICLSSCKSSVNSNQTKTLKELTCTLTLNETDKEALKKDDLAVKVKRGNEIKEDFHFNEKYTFKENDEIQIEVKKTLKEGEKFTLAVYLEDLSKPIVFGETKDKSLSFKVDSKLLGIADNLSGDKKFNILIRHTNNTTPNPGPDPSNMTILEFLDYKIGFDKDDKDKCSVVYGKDGKYDPKVLYDANSLGFGRKPNDYNLYYHGYNAKHDKLMAMNIEEEKQNDADFEKVGITENFKSIHDGLNKRWQAMRESTLAGGNLYYHTTADIHRYLISTIGSSYDFALGSDKEDYKLYMWTNSASKYSYYMDLRIAFVKKDEPDKGYSVHFCHVNDKKEYEPYVLHNTGDSKYTEYPPGAVPKYTESTEEGMRMFKLSSLLKTSLENLHKKESKEWKYSEQDLVDALLEKVKDKNYDIYIIFGYCRNVPDYDKIFANSFATGLGSHWCNVLKFNDPFWKTLETKKP